MKQKIVTDLQSAAIDHSAISIKSTKINIFSLNEKN